MPAASNALSTIDSAQPQTFEIRPFSGAVGAELIGLDLARPVSAE
ncbi:MAG TPA: taurine dioxygenase, partial [Pseudomonas sp.]|nr:taurine dioxygenase [Pseudomonas sp.]